MLAFLNILTLASIHKAFNDIVMHISYKGRHEFIYFINFLKIFFGVAEEFGYFLIFGTRYFAKTLRETDRDQANVLFEVVFIIQRLSPFHGISLSKLLKELLELIGCNFIIEDE